MFKKISVFLILSLMVVGVVSAADSTSFKVPDNFDDLGGGVYVLFDSHNKTVQILSVVNYTEHDAADYMTNDSENNYTVFEGENNTYNFIDGSTDEEGSFELIEANGVKFIIDFAKSGIDDKNGFNETFQRLMEFNKLNNVNSTQWE